MEPIEEIIAFLEKKVQEYDSMILSVINGGGDGDQVITLLDKRELYVTRLGRLYAKEDGMDKAHEVMDRLLTDHGHLFTGQAKPAAKKRPSSGKRKSAAEQDPE